MRRRFVQSIVPFVFLAVIASLMSVSPASADERCARRFLTLEEFIAVFEGRAALAKFLFTHLSKGWWG